MNLLIKCFKAGVAIFRMGRTELILGRKCLESAVFLICTVLLIGGHANGDANASMRGVNPKDRVPISRAQAKIDGVDNPNEAANGRFAPVPHSRIYYPTLGGFNILGTVQIGQTYREYQSNGTSLRRIAVGCQGRVHNVWYQMDTPDPSIDASIAYRNYHPGPAAGDTLTPETPYIIFAGRARYACLDVDFNGNPVIAFEQQSPLPGGTYMAADHFCNDMTFSPKVSFGQNVNCSGTKTGGDAVEGNYGWPFSCADKDGSGNTIGHAVSNEAGAVTGAVTSLVYYRSTAIVLGDAGCPASRVFIDSVYDISSVICQDPLSDKVAIVYTKPRAYMAEGNQYNNDVVYVESVNLGQTWGPRQNVSQYNTTELERAYTNLSAMYTGDQCLHILWDSSDYDSVAGTISTAGCKLWHWDNCAQCRSLLLDAHNSRTSCSPGAWNRNVTKMTISQCVRTQGTPGTGDDDTLLYAVYTYNKSDDGPPVVSNCSAAGYANGELYAQASATKGITWGPPTKLTTYPATDGCAAGNCYSEVYSSSAMYVGDSLRIQYILDKDAGGAVQTEGIWTDNPVMNTTLACFSMATFRSLAATPAQFLYPFHTKPGQNTDTSFVVTNSGNATAAFTVTVSYTSGSGWLSFPGGTSFNCPAGCTNSALVTFRAHGPASQGLYQATVHITYNAKDAQAVVDIPVNLYNLDPFFLPQTADIRTAKCRLGVEQLSRVGTNRHYSGFRLFEDTTDYLHDGSLLIATSTSTVSTMIGAGNLGQPSSPHNDPNLHRLYAINDITSDSLSSPDYRKASGKGVNFDSTIGFDATYYAPKHPSADSSYFFILVYKLYAGPKNPGATINNVTVAFCADWDIPTDTGVYNDAVVDETHQMVGQKNAHTTPSDAGRFGGMIGLNGNNTPIDGGLVLDNPRWMYPHQGYKADSIYNKITTQALGAYTNAIDSVTDLNSILILSNKNATINAAGSTYYVILMATPAGASRAGDLGNTGCKGLAWGKAHVPGMANLTLAPCTACACGDANGDGVIGNISDAVFLIQYIFQIPKGSPAPSPLCQGDANGDGTVNISDAVYLIQYVFFFTPVPHCP